MTHSVAFEMNLGINNKMIIFGNFEVSNIWGGKNLVEDKTKPPYQVKLFQNGKL